MGGRCQGERDGAESLSLPPHAHHVHGGSEGEAHHVPRPSSSGEGHNKIRLPLLKHLMVPDRPRRLTVLVPISGKLRVGNIVLPGPMPSHSVSTPRIPLDDHADILLLMQRIKSMTKHRLITEVPPPTHQYPHPFLVHVGRQAVTLHEQGVTACRAAAIETTLPVVPLIVGRGPKTGKSLYFSSSQNHFLSAAKSNKQQSRSPMTLQERLPTLTLLILIDPFIDALPLRLTALFGPGSSCSKILLQICWPFWWLVRHHPGLITHAPFPIQVVR